MALSHLSLPPPPLFPCVFFVGHCSWDGRSFKAPFFSRLRRPEEKPPREFGGKRGGEASSSSEVSVYTGSECHEGSGGKRGVEGSLETEAPGGLFSRPCGMDHGLVVHGREQLCISAKKRGGLFPPCLLFSFGPFLSANAPGIMPAVHVLHSLPGGGEEGEE